MAISAKELAQKLNVSAATVSMVLNKKPGISDKTREMVLTAAKKYGYEFPQKGETDFHGTIQFIIYKKDGTVVADTPFFSQVTAGIDAGCKAAGYELQITYFYENERIPEQIRLLSEKNFQGILLLGTEMEPEYFRYFSTLKVPLVVLDTYFEELDCDSVLINNVQGAYLATNYLISKGMKQVGYLRSSYSIGNFAERADGYYKALRCHKLPTDHPYVHRLAPSMEGAYEDMKELLDKKVPIGDAYFADNDLIAAGAMRAFKEYGYRIPEDVSIIGFDDMPICVYLEPTLSTMAVPKKRLGELAVECLVSKILHPTKVCVKTEVSVELKKRGSIRK
jgi:DNA-binding LacI/PurR family transcriptional regulator